MGTARLVPALLSTPRLDVSAGSPCRIQEISGLASLLKLKILDLHDNQVPAAVSSSPKVS